MIEDGNWITEEQINEMLTSIARENNSSKRDVAQTIRVALTGQETGLSLHAIMNILGRSTCLRRVDWAFCKIIEP